MLVCETCGSTEVQVLAWIDANTNEYKTEGLGDKNSSWCENCKAHVNLVEEENL